MQKNIQTTINFFNEHTPEEIDKKKINWTRATKKNKKRGKKYLFDEEKIISAMYRPFCEENFYYDSNLNEVIGTIKKFFPTGNEKNILICVSSAGGNNFEVFISKKICDLSFVKSINGGVQCFPLYYYERDESNLFSESSERKDGISDFILNLAEKNMDFL